MATVPTHPTGYVIDTSSILLWYVETYTPDIFPKLPERIDDLIRAGRLIAPEAVRGEIRPGDDVHKWAKAQSTLFEQEDQDVQVEVRRLMKTYRNPTKPQKGINGADPFVIAMAKVRGSKWAVVSDEHPGSEENPKIPFVCRKEKIHCVTFQEMMRLEKWQFR